MSNVAYDNVRSITAAGPLTTAPDLRSLVYHARGVKLDVEITPRRDGSTLCLVGRVNSRSDGTTDPSMLTVELLDQLGVVATATSDVHGQFQFDELSCGVYHIRITGKDWKMGIFGLTA